MIPDWRDGNCGLCPLKMVDIGQKYRERAISLCNGKCAEHARLLQQGWRLAEDGTYRKVSRIPQGTAHD